MFTVKVLTVQMTPKWMTHILNSDLGFARTLCGAGPAYISPTIRELKPIELVSCDRCLMEYARRKITGTELD